MGNAKLRMDLSQGIIEAEGTEEFVSIIYSDFKDQLAKNAVDTKKRDPKSSSDSASEKEIVKTKAKATKTPKTLSPKIKSTLTLLKDLDLKSGSNKSLQEFYNQYSPTSNMEKNLVFAYYLQQVMEETPISLDHVFTCYRHMSLKVPQALHQSLIDTARIHGWLDTSSMNDIKVPVSGLNHIEHDMKRTNGLI